MPNGNGKILKYVFDIDGTICTQDGTDYKSAKPKQDVISALNKLYEGGNKIVLFTARGTETGIDWFDFTKEQLASWGVKYHELRFGKPAADVYIDDKGCHVNDFINVDTKVSSLTTVDKCWGKEYLLDVTEKYAMKRLAIDAGKNISLQFHKNKRETWHIVSGTGIARVDGKEFQVIPGTTVSIPVNVIHQVKAITDLIIIESSTTELDDIVRIKEEF